MKERDPVPRRLRREDRIFFGNIQGVASGMFS